MARKIKYIFTKVGKLIENQLNKLAFQATINLKILVIDLQNDLNRLVILIVIILL